MPPRPSYLCHCCAMGYVRPRKEGEDMLGILSASLALTLLLETTAAALWGLRRQNLLLGVMVNLLTNPAAVLLHQLFPGWCDASRDCCAGIALYTAKGRGAEALPLCVACMCCAICVAYAQHIHARRLLATHRFTHRFRPRCQYRCHRLRYRYRRQCCRPSW